MNTGTQHTASNSPMACSLSQQDLAKRREELAADTFKNIQQVQELADGYALRYPGEKDWATKLLDFILFERACCPFFTFELTFEPDSGPIWLRVRGQEGVKEFLKQDLHLETP